MNIVSFFFYIFASMLLFAAFRVVTTKNPVYAALYLVFAFFQASALWMLLKAEFLSIMLVLVYIGAVMILFLFVVMMLDIDVETIRKGFWKNFPFIALVSSIIVAEIGFVFWYTYASVTAPITKTMVNLDGSAVSGSIDAQIGNTEQIGRLFFTQYLLPIEIAGTILLVGVIAAVALTLRARKDTKYISPSQQIRVRAKDRLIMQQVPVAQVEEPPQTVDESPSQIQTNESAPQQEKKV